MIRRIAPFALVAILVACAPANPASDQPVPSSDQASISAEPTPSATPLATPSGASPTEVPSAGAGLQADTIAEIVTTDLVVRSLPEISDASEIDPVAVPIGFLAYIVDGPVTADGYDWYQVAPFPPTFSDVVEEHPVFGWLAAAGKDGEPWIAPWDGDCPEPNWDGIMLSQRLLTLSCWGGADLTLEGALKNCDTPGPTLSEPAWLFVAPCYLIGPDYGDLLAGGLQLSYAPEIDATAREGAKVRVTGHLDDPAAVTCIVPVPGIEPTFPEMITLECRLRFVVTEITEL